MMTDPNEFIERTEHWPFDPSPRKIDKTDYGWVYCDYCDVPVSVVGHKCVKVVSTGDER